MTINLIRIFFLILSTVCGFYMGTLFPEAQYAVWIGAAGGFIGGLMLIFFEVKMERVSLRNLSAAAFGLIFGLFLAWIVTLIVRLIPMDPLYYSLAQIIFTLIFCYLGMVISLKGKDEFNLVIPYVRFSREDQRDQLFILDTSVIIDGRITGICETGFIQGKIVVPRFVLHELQMVADSADELKRNRGRRGLDLLEQLKEIRGIDVIIHDETLPAIREVDAKLVRLAKILDCEVLTNDFNLNKVAKVEGVKVLNINDLSSALRPVVYPGEQMSVMVKKEGKEKNQGVGFLDDGTMVVVDDARQHIGRSLRVSVTSVLQTSAGRMIFATVGEQKQVQKKQNGQQRQRKNDQNRKKGGAPPDGART